MITAYHLQVLFHNFIKCASKQLDGQTKLSNIKDILASWIILKWPRFLFHIFRFPHFQRGASCLPRFVTSWSASCWSDFRPRRLPTPSASAHDATRLQCRRSEKSCESNLAKILEGLVKWGYSTPSHTFFLIFHDMYSNIKHPFWGTTCIGNLYLVISFFGGMEAFKIRDWSIYPLVN